MTGPATSVDTELEVIAQQSEIIRGKVRVLEAQPGPGPGPDPTPPPTGNPFDAFFVLPDQAQQLRANPLFSLRLANPNMWDAAKGYNNLGHQIVVAATAANVSKTYTEDKNFFANPERGTFFQIEGPDSGYDQQDASWLRAQRINGGHTLARRIFNLRQFRDTNTIATSYLEAVQRDAAAAIEAGIKYVGRPAYNYRDVADSDVPAARMLAHITQLAAAVNPVRHAFAGLEHGWIGKWGELHGSSNFSHEWWASDNGPGNSAWVDRPPITQAILNAFLDLPVANRYPRILYYTVNPGGAPRVTQSERLGFVNDSFMQGEDEGGTFQESKHSTPDGRAWLRQFVERSGRMVGGEHVYGGESPAQLAAKYRYFQEQDWSYLNAGYDPRTINIWKAMNHPDGGTYWDQIRIKLGARLTLRRASLPSAIVPGQPFNVSLTLDNVGWAAPFRERPALFVLRDRVTGVERGFTLTNNANVRQWTGGEVTVSGTFTL